MSLQYDPFQRGSFPVGVRTIRAQDNERGGRIFPCEIWYPESTLDMPWPLIVFSHSSGGNRRQSAFLTTHLASHGYVVAALDHSEIVESAMARKDGETPEQSAARVQEWIDNRVPDVRFLIDHLLGVVLTGWADADRTRIGIIGHSFGGWTALASAEVEPRIRAIVALAPGGNSKPLPGIIPCTLTFAWIREVPTLYLAAELDVATPLAGMYELFERTQSPKQMFILRRADHVHFMNEAETLHESFRLSAATGDIAAMIKNMRPFAELCPVASAHAFTRALTLAHMDANLKQQNDARRFLAADAEASLSAHGVDAVEHRL